VAFSKPCRTSYGLAAAVTLLRASRRKPADTDRPTASTYRGRMPRHLDGQLALHDTGGKDAA
jgi:hypothetical protein